MIKQITLENFFSFRSETITLDPNANVLVGINGSGKTNLLKALKLLQRVSAGRMQELIMNHWGGIDAMLYQGNDNTLTARLEVVFDKNAMEPGTCHQDIHYELTLHRAAELNYYISERLFHPVESEDDLLYLKFSSGDGYIRGGNDEDIVYSNVDPRESVLSKLFDLNVPVFISCIKKAIDDIVVYDYFDTRPDAKMRKPIFPTGESRLLSHGSNLAQILNTIKINDKAGFKEILECLNGVNKHFKGLDFNQIGGNIELMLEEYGFNTSTHIAKISDGTLKFLSLLSIFYNKNHGRLVCIEEPENGLHPDMIHAIVRAVRNTEKETQYIFSTHSDILLDGFCVEEVRVLEKNKENATIVRYFTEENFRGWYEEYALGQMWRKGDIGGNRW